MSFVVKDALVKEGREESEWKKVSWMKLSCSG
jgi:hypothetical protein